MHSFKKGLLLISFIFFYFHIAGQDYISPVDYAIVLSGSFGELRATHFHTGLDIKPSGKGQDVIKCIAAGHISRIKVGRSGYGRAIYIDHPNGHTSVYAHLDSYSPTIDSIVLDYQRKAQSYEIEILPKKGKYLIAKGQELGILGNSGRSYGPHLHFEIRDTKSELPINPLLFGIGPEDHIKPTINYLKIYHIDNEWQDQEVSTFYQSGQTIKVPPGKIGIGLNGYDQMDGASNYNGIYTIEAYIDDLLYYKHTLDTVSFFEMDQIKAHVDYRAKKSKNATIIRLFKLPGNKLRILDVARSQGVLTLDDGDMRSITIKAIDWHGNTTVKSVKLIADASIDQLADTASFHILLTPEERKHFTMNNMNLSFSKNAVAKPEKIIIISNSSVDYTIGNEQIALIGSMTIGLVSPISVQASKSNLFIGLIDGKDIIDYGSEWSGDTLRVKVEEFGRYKILKDDVAPTIKPANYPNSSGKYHTFSMKDDVTCKGKAADFQYKVFVNDVFIPCEYKDITNILYIPTTICSAKDHLVIEAIDRMGNKAAYEANR